MKRTGTKTSRKEIIEAARKIFFVSGYEKTSVDMIANEIGVAKGTIYLYFKSKQKLFIAVAMGIMDRFEAVIEDGRSSRENDFHVKIRILINSVLKFVETNERFFDMWQRQYQNFGKTFTKAQHRRIKEKHHKIMGIFSEVVQEGINKGFIRKVNPKVAGVVLLTMITAFSSLDLFTTKKRVLDRKTSEILDIFLKGVGK